MCSVPFALSAAFIAGLLALVMSFYAASNADAGLLVNPNESEPTLALATTIDADNSAPIVIEFFLSQSCPACPAVAKDAKMLANRNDVITLSWHVDYWDNLQDPKKGRWADPFAKAEFTERQTQYNDNIRGRPRNFTPQAVINGEKSVIAKNMGSVDKALAKASAIALEEAIIEVAKSGNELTINLTPNKEGLEARLVYFQKATETVIQKGLNHGVNFVDANVVYQVETLPLNETPTIRPAPASGMGCAILIHEEGQGPLRAAQYCP